MSEPFFSPGEVVAHELGIGYAARKLKVSRTTVWRWGQPAGRGTNGIVPACYHRDLLKLAQQRGASLTSEDLVLGRPRQTGAR